MKLILFILLFISIAWADSFKIGGVQVEFTGHNGLLLSGCDKKCDALSSVKKHPSIRLKDLQNEKKFASSLGSEVCAKIYHAKSLLGRAVNGDGRAFCYFPDHSLIEINSLSLYLKARVL